MAASIITRGSSSLESLKGRSRPKIQIDLVNQTEGLVSSYTTKGQIEGTVTIRVDMTRALRTSKSLSKVRLTPLSAGQGLRAC